MSSFDDLLADANDPFIEAFGERAKIILRPPNDRPRPVTAIIDRAPPEPIEAGKKGAAYTLIIAVKNNATEGLLPAEFDAETWRVDVPLVYGGPLVQRGFVREQFDADGGMVRLKVM